MNTKIQKILDSLDENLLSLQRLKHEHYVQLKKLEQLESISSAGRHIVMAKHHLDCVIEIDGGIYGD